MGKNSPIIIAEIGWNFLGDMVLAQKMIKAAAKNGADFVKFQTWSVDRLKPGEWDNDGRRQIYEDAELSKDDHETLIDLCGIYDVEFLSSVFSIKDAELLLELNLDSIKIPSFESRNRDLVEFCNNNFTNIIMSTGTSTLDEIRDVLSNCDIDKFTLMHCVSAYPLNPIFANLPRINDLKKLTSKVGYSDHMEGIESAKISMEYDVVMIEKHFTTDNNLPGRDNKFAILPEDLKNLRDYIALREYITIYRGPDYIDDVEHNSREYYTGRFDGKEKDQKK